MTDEQDRTALESGLLAELKQLRKHYGRVEAGDFDSYPLLNRYVGHGYAHHTLQFFVRLADMRRDDIQMRVALGTLGVEVPGLTAQQRTEAIAEREGVSVRHVANLSNAGMAKLAALIRSWSETEGGGGPTCEILLFQVREDIVNVGLRVVSPGHVVVYGMPDIAVNGEPLDVAWATDEDESDDYWGVTKYARANVLLEDDRQRRLELIVEWSGSTRPVEYQLSGRAMDDSLVYSFQCSLEGCRLLLWHPEIDSSEIDQIIARARRYGVNTRKKE